MDTQEFDRILRHTLSDHRLSRGEKRVLSKITDEMAADDRQLSVLRNRAFEVARTEVADPRASAVLEWLEEVIKALQPREQAAHEPPPIEVYFSPGEDCRRKVVRLLSGCRSRADICVFTITDNHITDAILDAKGRDIRIRVITDNEKASDEGSDVSRLERVGIPVRVDNTSHHMHHKFAIFDQAAVLTGSYNWTRSAAMFNEENLIVTHDQRIMKAFSEQFERLWENLK